MLHQLLFHPSPSSTNNALISLLISWSCLTVLCGIQFAFLPCTNMTSNSEPAASCLNLYLKVNPVLVGAHEPHLGREQVGWSLSCYSTDCLGLQGGECGVVWGMEAEPGRTSLFPPRPRAVGAHLHFVKYSLNCSSLRYRTCGPYIVTKGFVPI